MASLVTTKNLALEQLTAGHIVWNILWSYDYGATLVPLTSMAKNDGGLIECLLRTRAGEERGVKYDL